MYALKLVVKPFWLFAFLPAVLSAAPALEAVKPILSQIDGGAAEPPGFQYAPGEILYFNCRIAGFGKTEENRIHVAYSVQAFDPKGVPLDEVYKNEVKVELTSNDKDWMPKIATTISLPPLAPAGKYKIVVKLEDQIGKTSGETTVPFQVRGYNLEPSDTLVVRNFHFYRAEDDTQPMPKAVYKPGDGVWAKFDLTGFKYGPRNQIDVSYVTSVIAPGGKVLWTQPEPAGEKAEAFYPKLFVPASMGITLQKNIAPGEYTIAVQAKDAVGNQTFEEKFTFVIE